MFQWCQTGRLMFLYVSVAWCFGMLYAFIFLHQYEREQNPREQFATFQQEDQSLEFRMSAVMACSTPHWSPHMTASRFVCHLFVANPDLLISFNHSWNKNIWCRLGFSHCHGTGEVQSSIQIRLSTRSSVQICMNWTWPKNLAKGFQSWSHYLLEGSCLIGLYGTLSDAHHRVSTHIYKIETGKAPGVAWICSLISIRK